MSRLTGELRLAEGSAILVLAAGLVAPGGAWATTDGSDGALWNTPTSSDRCQFGAPISEKSTEVVLALQSSPTDNDRPRASTQGARTSTTDGDPDPCSGSPEMDEMNLCHERAGAPASLRPRLVDEHLAEHRADRAPDALLRRALAAAGDVDESAAPSETPAVVDVLLYNPAEPPDPRRSDNSCTAAPEHCKSVPPSPPTLTLHSSSPSARHRTDRPGGDRRDARLVRIVARPAGAGVGAGESHDSPPDRPPK